MSRGAVRVAIAQPRSAIRSLAGAIRFEHDVPESVNLERAERMVAEAAAAGARLVAFPELFPGPSADDSDLSVDDVTAALRSAARAHGVAIGFGCERPGADGAPRNAYALLDGPSDTVVWQEKVVPAIGERSRPGEGCAILDVGPMRVAAAICWEAWFPEIARARVLAGADLVLFPTGAIVQETQPQWLRIIGARASENVCFTACSVNLLGVERGMGAVYGPEAELGRLDGRGLLVAELDLARLDALRGADDELTSLKRYATLPGLLRALPETVVEAELEALRKARA